MDILRFNSVVVLTFVIFFLQKPNIVNHLSGSLTVMSLRSF